jgi:hypothetical protein
MQREYRRNRRRNAMKKVRLNTFPALVFAVAVLIGTGCNSSGGINPTVQGVSVTPPTANVPRGGTAQFEAEAIVFGGASDAVTWSIVETGTAAGTTISATGLLTVAASEGLTTLTVRARSAQEGFTDVFGDAIVTPYDPTDPTVLSIEVTPDSISVAWGATQQFTADVEVLNGAAETVAWSIVETEKAEGTVISDTGLLTVAADETLTTLTVRATSTVEGFTGVYGEAIVTPYDPTAPAVISISVSPDPVSVEKGATKQFTADVTVINGAAETVVWSIVETGKAAGTTISTAGLLSVDAAETLSTLTVRATSDVAGFTSVHGDAAVTVEEPGGPDDGAVNVSLSIEDKALVLDGFPSSSIVIYRAGTGAWGSGVTKPKTLTITITDPSSAFASYTWKVDGTDVGTGAITIDAGDYTYGGHWISLLAVDSDGVTWSAGKPFTVQDY